MGQLERITAEFSELRHSLWPEAGGAPETKDPAEAELLRMYPPGCGPRAGTLRSDLVDVHSHWHFHDMHQLSFTFEGAMTVEAAGGRHLVSQQLALWIPAGVVHRASLHRIRSGSVFLPQAMVPAPGNRIRAVLVNPLMREMLREAQRWPLQGPNGRVRAAFFEALAALCGEWIEDGEDALFLPALTEPRLRRALAYTAQNIDAKLPDVCRHAGMSERSLRRRFRAEAGMTWEAYRQRGRLLRAVALLNETASPIAEIAVRCGFESPSAFAKAFRAAMGETPRAYRLRAGRD